MNRPISLDELHEKIEKLENVDKWRLGGNRHANHYSKGSEARKMLKAYSVGKNKPQIPKQGEKRKQYIKKKKEITQKMKHLEKEFDDTFPGEIKTEDRKTLKALLRLLNRQERTISAPLHLIFAAINVSWNDMIDVYNKWKLCSLAETSFPAFMWRTYDVVLGMKNSWQNIRILRNDVSTESEKWVRSDFFPFLHERTKIRWRYACDGFPQSRIFRDHNTWYYPWGSKVYFNPPFKDYKYYFDHLWPQFLSGRVTDILLVMFRTKWTGGDNDKSKWISRLHKYENKTVIEFPYNFWKPDGSRHKGNKHVVCVHLFHD